MTPAITSSSPTPQTGSTQGAPAINSGGIVDKNMFLQLLVAQLKNQDPLNPSDSTQFVTQLAQFQQMEQATNTGSDITAIRQDLDTLVANSSTSAQKS